MRSRHHFIFVEVVWCHEHISPFVRAICSILGIFFNLLMLIFIPASEQNLAHATLLATMERSLVVLSWCLERVANLIAWLCDPILGAAAQSTYWLAFFKETGTYEGHLLGGSPFSTGLQIACGMLAYRLRIW